MPTKDSLQQTYDQLQQSVQTIQGDMEVIQREIEALEIQEIFQHLPGTSWVFPNLNCRAIYYQGGYYHSRSPDAFENYIRRDLQLYPHGRKHINGTMCIACDDGSIELQPNPSDAMWKQVQTQPDYDPYRDILIAFIQQYQLKVSTTDIQRTIQHDEQHLREQKTELHHILTALGPLAIS